MNHAITNLQSYLALLPVASQEEVDKASRTLGDYLDDVVNAEGRGGVGGRVVARFPVLEDAVGHLGHALVQQFLPTARLPEAGDDSAPARQAGVVYTSLGAFSLGLMPRIGQQAGPLAAAAVVYALHGYVEQHPAAESTPSPSDVTTMALEFLEDAISIQRMVDSRERGAGARGADAAPVPH